MAVIAALRGRSLALRQGAVVRRFARAVAVVLGLLLSGAFGLATDAFAQSFTYNPRQPKPVT